MLSSKQNVIYISIQFFYRKKKTFNIKSNRNYEIKWREGKKNKAKQIRQHDSLSFETVIIRR